MATNATSWFYAEPETGRPFFISERVNHTFWSNRITDVYFTCTQATAPYLLVGIWAGMEVELEFEPNAVFILRMAREDKRFIKGVQEILGFKPTVAYSDADRRHVVEWYVTQADKRLQEVQSNSSLRDVKVYKR